MVLSHIILSRLCTLFLSLSLWHWVASHLSLSPTHANTNTLTHAPSQSLTRVLKPKWWTCWTLKPFLPRFPTWVGRGDLNSRVLRVETPFSKMLLWMSVLFKLLKRSFVLQNDRALCRMYEARPSKRSLMRTQPSSSNIAINTTWLRDWLRSCLLSTFKLPFPSNPIVVN